MSEKKRVYESDAIALPPLRMVLGEVPVPDPDKRGANGRRRGKQKPEQQEEVVQRIIRRLKKD